MISEINKEYFRQLVEEGVVSGGMITKLENAFQAIDSGVKEVVITMADNIGDESKGNYC